MSQLSISVTVLLLSAFAHSADLNHDDTNIDATFYSDGSCYVHSNFKIDHGKTIIDVDVDEVGSRMLLHCDTDNEQRLTLLVRGNTLNAAQRVPFLSKTEIVEGEFGMIAWLTNAGIHYTDMSVPRRYVVSGSVIMTKSPPVIVTGTEHRTERQSFAQITGSLEPRLSKENY